MPTQPGEELVGRLFLVLGFSFGGEKITEIDVIADPARPCQLDLADLDD